MRALDEKNYKKITVKLESKHVFSLAYIKQINSIKAGARLLF